jgi:hypothetical protein
VDSKYFSFISSSLHQSPFIFQKEITGTIDGRWQSRGVLAGTHLVLDNQVKVQAKSKFKNTYKKQFIVPTVRTIVIVNIPQAFTFPEFFL